MEIDRLVLGKQIRAARPDTHDVWVAIIPFERKFSYSVHKLGGIFFLFFSFPPPQKKNEKKRERK